MRKYIQRFSQVQHNIPNISAAADYRDHSMRKFASPRCGKSLQHIAGYSTIAELFQLADKCARAEEGRCVPRTRHARTMVKKRSDAPAWAPASAGIASASPSQCSQRNRPARNPTQRVRAKKWLPETTLMVLTTKSTELLDTTFKNVGRWSTLPRSRRRSTRSRIRRRSPRMGAEGSGKKGSTSRGGRGGGAKNQERPARGRDKKDRR